MTSAAGRLEQHHATFRELVAAARRERRPERAAVAAQTAAHYAWFNHPGVFADPDLEDLLTSLGGRLPAARPRSGGTDRILHVVTQAYGTGGSTQAVSRWVALDHGRTHRVCLTRQGGVPVPAKVLAADPGPVRLDLHRGGLLARAARLRAAAAGADVVLLHTHPYDVVPVIALAGHPAVVLVNHADHVFWVGGSVTSVAMHMRDSGRILAEERRGLDPARGVVMARPLAPPDVVADRTADRLEHKRRLGVEPDQVLVVTAADGSKYRPVSDPGFLDLVVPVVEADPRVVLLAAGPAPDAPDWAAAAERTGGRVRPLGLLPGVQALHRAADVYLDSYPFASLTSMLEAAVQGTPVMTFRGHPAECAVFGSDTRGLDDHLLAPEDAASFRAELRRLVDDPELRFALGAKTRDAVIGTHTGEGWRSAAAELYRAAGEAGAPPPPGPAPFRTGPVDELVDLVMTRTGFSSGPDGSLRDALGLLPAPERLAAWRRLRAAGQEPGPRGLLSERSYARALRLRNGLRDRRR